MSFTIKALDDVSLNIDQGEFVAIMRPSGSGKSTLMNIIGCLDVVDKGIYDLDGQAINVLKDSGLAEIRNQKIGFVFQSFNLLPRISAYGNVELPQSLSALGSFGGFKLRISQECSISNQ